MWTFIGILVAVLVVGIGAILVYRNNQKPADKIIDKVEDKIKK